ncbi:Uncharacterised protein [Chlamydia trachomatis]|nr:Uncharacterised protein [Chlamydia trachomatis]
MQRSCQYHSLSRPTRRDRSGTEQAWQIHLLPHATGRRQSQHSVPLLLHPFNFAFIIVQGSAFGVPDTSQPANRCTFIASYSTAHAELLDRISR